MKICGGNRQKTRLFRMYFHGNGFNPFLIILFLYKILVAKNMKSGNNYKEER
ncbi:Uncharacterized protein dnm_098090 [Desulfonema magnum]|uniref:Uncharacterized protein n=1 Tax=Desulfonema magnum TaxID=45655 RepID=A0A975GU21_9BACT|nr:Uncharacterized protein dnm_098090 [Desulfonema magnum]